MANEDAESYEKIREEALAEPGKAAEPENVAEPEAAAEPEPKAEKATEPKAAEPKPEKAAEPKAEKAAEPKAKKAAEPKAAGPKADKPKQPRMICEGCGRSFSIHTKRHKCNPPAGFVPAKGEKKPQDGSRLPAPAPPPSPAPSDGSRLDGSRLPPPAALPQPAPDITLADVTRFLFAESRARREQRRDDLLAKMF